MDKRKTLYTALALATLALLTPLQSVAADPAATPGIDKRLENQDRRIEKGADTGQLTERESARLEKRQNKIQGDLDKAKADGAVTKKESAKLHGELNRSSGAIALQKHDRQHDYDHDGKTDRPRKK